MSFMDSILARNGLPDIAEKVFAAQRLKPPDVDALLEYQGFDLFERLFAQNKGVVVASAHLGAWELLASACGRRGIPMNQVTRALKGNSNAAIQGARRRSGLTEIPPKGALTAGAAALRRGEVVVNLVDQNMLPKRAVFAPTSASTASVSSRHSTTP